MDPEQDVDDDDNWLKQLVAGVGAAAGTALIVGVVLGVAAVGAAGTLGLLGGSPDTSGRETLYIPPLSITHTPTPQSSGSASATPQADTTPSTKAPKRHHRRATRIVLTASPRQAASFERIYLSGTYPAGDGHSLRVQRFRDGWSDFPVSTSVHGGRFSTYVQTGNAGRNRFRVLDTSTGRASNPVTVTIG